MTDAHGDIVLDGIQYRYLTLEEVPGRDYDAQVSVKLTTKRVEITKGDMRFLFIALGVLVLFIIIGIGLIIYAEKKQRRKDR